MRKTYVLDTNVLLHNPDAIFGFEEHTVIIPFTVITELDEQKKRQDEIGRNARKVNGYLDELREKKGKLADGVSIGKGTLRVEVNYSTNGSIRGKNIPFLNMSKNDSRILAVAVGLKNRRRKIHEKESEVILVSKDLNLRVQADICGVRAEDYRKDKVADYGELYTGFSEIALTEEQIQMLEKYKAIVIPEGIKAYPNQFFICKIDERQLILRNKNGFLVPLQYSEESNWGLTPLNLGQMMAQELLMDDDVPVVTIIGQAGTGKTLISLAVGMETVVEKKLYNNLIVMRPIVPMGNDIGYLPGSKDEKIDPWMSPIYDNLCYLMRDADDPMEEINDLKRRGGLEIEVLTYIRGRSIPKQFIICDEAQNLTPLMIKTLGTRVGEGSKIVLTGDPSQIDTPYLDASSNGLSYFVENMKAESVSGHITLLKTERSLVAEVCARVL
jgi:PhoH-like ATPase